MKIAGVSINKENLPKREDVFRMALNTKEFKDNPLREEQINKILDESGLWGEPYELSEEGTKGIVYRKTIEEADKEIKELNKKVVEPKIENDGLHTTVTKKNKRDK